MSDTVETTEASPDEPKGIGGWLLLPLIGLIGGPLYTVWLLVDRTFPELAARAPRNLLAAEVSLVLVTLPFFLFQVYCLVRFLQKRREVPWLMTILYGLNILALLIILIAHLKGYEFPGQGIFTTFATEHPIHAIVQIGISVGFIAYFHDSVRVKNTFTVTSKQALEKKELRGIKGAIWFPLLFLCVMTIASAVQMLNGSLPTQMLYAAERQHWPALAYDIIGLALIFYGAFCFYALFRRWKPTPWLMIGAFAGWIVRSFVALLVKPLPLRAALFLSALCVASALYFLLSKRVKNTFVR